MPTEVRSRAGSVTPSRLSTANARVVFARAIQPGRTQKITRPSAGEFMFASARSRVVLLLRLLGWLFPVVQCPVVGIIIHGIGCRNGLAIAKLIDVGQA